MTRAGWGPGSSGSHRKPDNMVSSLLKTAFSFLTSERLNFKKLVVGFGRPPANVYLEAEIRHVTPFHHEGRDMYLAGCEYVGRPEDA